MFLSNFSIKRPVTTVAIVIVLMCLGLLAFKKLRVNQIPDVEPPVMVVNIPYPGASPETVEREIINRVEKALQYVTPERLSLHPDCGFAPGSAADIPIDEAYQKLCNEVAAARILRQRYA